MRQVLFTVPLVITGCLPDIQPHQQTVYRHSTKSLTKEVMKSDPLRKLGSRSKLDPAGICAVDEPEQRLDTTADTRRGAAPAHFQQMFISEDRAKLYNQFWPKSTGNRLAGLKGRVHWYDDESIPAVYQVWDRGLAGGFSHVGAAGDTANNEFPWRNPAGVAQGSNVKTLRFVKLTDKPILWWRGVRENGSFAAFKWRYPEGTIFGEVLLVSSPQGLDHTFEVRTREKKGDGMWTMQAYRPFPTRQDLDKALSKHGLDTGNMRAFFRHLDSGHRANGFVADAWLAPLNPLPAAIVSKLLDDTPFQPSRGKEFSDGIPTATSTHYSVVPVGFTAAFVPVNDQSCMRCHESAGRVVNLDGDARWRLRGSDGIFSFHPFEASSFNIPPVKLSRRLVEAGLLKEWK